VYTESLPGEANVAPEPNLPAIRAEIDWTQVWTVTEEIADLGVEAVAGLPSDAPRKSRPGRSACKLRKDMNIESPQSESGDWSAKRHRTTPDRRRRRRETSGCRKLGDGSTDTYGEAAAREGQSGGTTAASANTRRITVTCDPQICARTKRIQLRGLVEDGQPWTTQNVLHLSQSKLGVTYHLNYM
jgi:hypothetical protein